MLLGFGRVGLFGFGGGPAMLPLIQGENMDTFIRSGEVDFLLESLI